MTPKRQRLRFLILSLLVMGAAAFAILRSFGDNLVFFFTPVQWQQKHASGELETGREVRIGGLVKKGSVQNLPHGGIVFTITDLSAEMKVRYQGLLPSLFREGQGVVAQGTVNEKGELDASTILAKHDENYMPPDVVAQLKKSGRWKEYGGAYGAGGANAPATLEHDIGHVQAPRSLRSGSRLRATQDDSSTKASE